MTRAVGTILVFISLLTFVASLMPTSALAEKPLRSVSATESVAIKSSTTTVAKKVKTPNTKALNPDDSLQKIFYQAVNQIYERKLGAASQTLESLKNFAKGQGYVNLPDFSFELLNRAIAAREAGNIQEVSYFVHHSILLSPEDPRVNLAAASFYKVLGVGKALGYFLKSIRSLSANPVVYYTVKANLWIVALIAITLALFITNVVQMIRNGELVYRFFKERLPRSASCILGALALSAVMIVPLFAGILTMLVVWSLMLAICVKSCRWFAFVCGAVIALWGWAIPEISTIGFNVEQRINQVVQEINNRSFTPQGEDYIVRALERSPNNPLLLFALAELYQLKGLDNEAKKRFEEVVAKGGNNEPLKVAAHINVATIEYQNKNLKVAESMFEDIESRGYGSFELYYNLALTKLALLDTDSHRTYFARAQEIDAVRAEEIENAQGEKRNALMVPVPPEFYNEIIFQDIEGDEEQKTAEYIARRDGLAGALMKSATPARLSLIGLLLMFLSGLVFRSHARRGAIDPSLPEGVSSVLWLIVPAGHYVAGKRPVLGSLMLSVILALIVVALEAPIHFFGSLPVSVSFQSVIISAAFTVCVAMILLAMLGYAVQVRRT